MGATCVLPSVAPLTGRAVGICVFQRGFKVLVFGKAHLVEQNKVHLWPCIFVLRYVRYCHATMREDTLGDA